MDYKNKIPWFEKDKDIFKKTSNHHAYIFEGPKGIGKNLFTLEVAKGFLWNAKSLPPAGVPCEYGWGLVRPGNIPH